MTAPVLSDGVSTMVPGISERSNGVTRFLHLDRLGTNAKTTDGSSSVVESRQYDAFGLPVSINSPSGSQAGFASAYGVQEDAESGLKLMGHRYYDPGTGRFITRDPIGSGTNWYRYCDNNPLADVDPEGLAPQKGHGGPGRGSPKKKVKRPEHKDPVGDAIRLAALASALAMATGLEAAAGAGVAAVKAGVAAVEANASQGRRPTTKSGRQRKFRRELVKHSNGHNTSDAE